MSLVFSLGAFDMATLEELLNRPAAIEERNLLGMTVEEQAPTIMHMASDTVNRIVDEDAILTILGEVGPYGKEGMQWVASSIRNRGGTQGAYGKNNPNVVNKKYTQQQYNDAKTAWEESKTTNFTDAKHWFSDADMKQDNVKRIIKEDKLEFIKKVGENNFYRK